MRIAGKNFKLRLLSLTLTAAMMVGNVPAYSIPVYAAEDNLEATEESIQITPEVYATPDVQKSEAEEIESEQKELDNQAGEAEDSTLAEEKTEEQELLSAGDSQEIPITSDKVLLHCEGEKVTGTYDGQELIIGVDYEVSSPCKDENGYYYYVYGIGNFCGNQKIYYSPEYYEGNDKYAYNSNASLEFDISLSLNIYINVSMIDGESGKEGVFDTSKIIINDGPEEELGQYRYNKELIKIDALDVTAKELDKPYTIKIKNSEGQYVRIKSETGADYELKYSVCDYLNSAMCSSEEEFISDEMKRLAYNTNVYGQCAKKYFCVDNESMTSPVEVQDVSLSLLEQYKKEISGDMPQGIKYAGASLTLLGEVNPTLYFELEDGYSIEQYKFSVTMDDDIYEDEPSYNEGNGYYYIKLKPLPIPEYDRTFIVSIADSNNECGIKYNALSYLYDVLSKQYADEDLKNLCKAMYWQFDSAKCYFDDSKINVGQEATYENYYYKSDLLEQAGILAKEMYNYMESGKRSSYRINGIDYNAWSGFSEAARQYVTYGSPLYSKVNADYWVGIYRGYNSDDIYLYYGDMTHDGKRGKENGASGFGNWMQVKTYSKGEENKVRLIEWTNAKWQNDVPNGEFLSEVFTEIITGKKVENIHRNFRGNLINGAYDGKIEWSTVANIDAIEGESTVNALNTEDTYEAYFSDGRIRADNIDSEKYTTVMSLISGRSEKMIATKNYGLNGIVVLNDVNVGTDRVNNLVNGTVSGNSDNTTGNVDYHIITYGTQKTREYADYLIEKAVAVAYADELNMDDWNDLKSTARKTDISGNSSLIAVLDDGAYIQIYYSTTNETYYVYLGEFNGLGSYIKQGYGRAITASDYYSRDSFGDEVYSRYLEEYKGEWIAGVPCGDFICTKTAEVYNTYRSSKVTRTYTGSAQGCGFDGLIYWTVDSEISYHDGVSKSRHDYCAQFKQGFIQSDLSCGYTKDLEGNVYIPDLNGGYTEDKIYIYDFYNCAGYWEESRVDGEEIKYRDESLYGPPPISVSGNTLYDLSDIENAEQGANSSRYDGDQLADIAYKLINAKDVDGEAWNDFSASVRKSEIANDHPLTATMPNGKSIGIYIDEYKNVYIYYGDIIRGIREGKGQWMSVDLTVTQQEPYTVKALTVHKATGVWIEDMPNGQFVDQYSKTMITDEYSNTIKTTYTVNVVNGLYSGEVFWNEIYEYRSDYYGNYDSRVDYKANFSQGQIKGYTPDKSGFVNVESLTKEYYTNSVRAAKRHHIEGADYIVR